MTSVFPAPFHTTVSHNSSQIGFKLKLATDRHDIGL
jgi:hypothetical protein